MERKPDDVKKGLEYISIKDVARKLDAWEDGIPYDYVEDAAADALAFIQQLQDDNAEKDKSMQQLERSLSFARDLADGLKAATVKQEQELYVSEERNRQLEAQNAELSGKIGQLQAERDDLKRYIRQLEAEKDMTVKDVEKRCITCKNSYLNNSDIDICPYVQQCHDHSKWEWCGVVEEE